jgi:acyl-CoA thioesterase I
MSTWGRGVGKSDGRRYVTPLLAIATALAAACGAPTDGVGGSAPVPDRPAAAPVPAPVSAPTSASIPTPPATATPEATPVAARPRLVVLGDSIAAGYGLRRDESFPARLQERIDREGLGFEVVNAGVSGDTSAGGLRRLDWALDGDVRVLVLELGGNDGLRGLPPAELKKNLTAIVRAARKRHLAVLLCGMEAPPNAGAAYATAFREAFSAVAREERVPFVRFVLDKVAGVDGLNQDDGIHPNARGARIVADTVWPALRPLLTAAAHS